MIDRAKGLLMDEHGLTEADAFSFIQQTAMSEPHDDGGGGRADPRGQPGPVRLGRAMPSSRARAYARRVAKLLLLDGNSLTYRAFFALPTDMATASGQVTNAVFGFTSMLINLLQDHQPDGVVVAFDRPEPTFRHDGDPDVQGQPRGGARHPPPADGPRPRGASRRSSIAVVDAGRASRPTTSSPRSPTQAATAATTSIIVTGDRDSYQLVEDPHVKVLYNRRGVSATTRSTTRPASRSAPASRRRSTRSTRRCAATRPTTCPACPASARRRRPS